MRQLDEPMDKTPKLSERLVRLDAFQRDDIARELVDLIEAGIQTQGRMPDWWLQVERVYRNETPENSNAESQGVNDPGYSQFHVPYVQPRLDMLTAQVCSVVSRQKPIMTDTADDEELSEPRQSLLHRVWDDAGKTLAIKQAATMCGTKDLCIHRMAPGALNGTAQWDVIDPEDFSVYPAMPQGIQAATLAGHRFYRRRRVVNAMQDRGEYYPVEDLPESSQAEHDRDQEQVHTGTNLSANSPDSPNELIELWDCVVRLVIDDKPERLYRVTVDYVGCSLLALEEYDYPYIWYFRSFYIGSPKYFYSGMSVGRSLYPGQTAYNALWSCYYGGKMSSAKPDVYGPPLDGGEKYTKGSWGSYQEIQQGVSAFSPSVSFNGADFVPMLGLLERNGDQVARISQNTQGAQATGQTTATEQSIIAAGVATGVENYIENFTLEFPMMAEHTMQIIYNDYDAFATRYGTDEAQEEPQVTPEDLKTFLDASLPSEHLLQPVQVPQMGPSSLMPPTGITDHLNGQLPSDAQVTA